MPGHTEGSISSARGMSREKSGTRNYHWNVVGPQFNDLHTFFEAQYNALNTVVDDVAERARALDGNAIGTWQNLLSTPDSPSTRTVPASPRDAGEPAGGS